MIETMDLADGPSEAPSLLLRRGLVVAVLLGVLGYAVGSLQRWPVLTAPAVLTMVVAWVLLRRAVQTVADLPDDQLDERQIGVRDRAYLASYRLVGGVVGGLVLSSILWDVFDVEEISTVTAQTVAGSLLFFMIALPSCVVGWSERGS